MHDHFPLKLRIMGVERQITEFQERAATIMKQVYVRKGNLLQDNFTPPRVGDNDVLIRVHFASFSNGTDTTTINLSAENLLQKAVRKPMNILKGFKYLSENGLAKFKNLIELQSFSEIGYSCSGVVIEVGKSVSGIHPGQFVSAVGAGRANIASEVSVPSRLVTCLQDKDKLLHASFTAQAAIAMNAVREAKVQLGDHVCVVGTGLIGLFAVAFAKLSGAEVTAIDLESDRLEVARRAGATWLYKPGDLTHTELRRITGGVNFDKAISFVGSSDDNLNTQLAKQLRRRGNLILAGNSPFSLDREVIYKTGINVKIATSYGPGRYDPSYEEDCTDYPLEYVRWTAARNCELFVKLLTLNKLQWFTDILPDIVNERDELNVNLKQSLAIAYQFDVQNENDEIESAVDKKLERTDVVVAPGSYFFDVYAPIFQKENIQYSAISSNAKSQYILKKNKIEIIDPRKVNLSAKRYYVTSRHNVHAEQIQTLLTEKSSVLMEKPLCINQTQLLKLKDFFQNDNLSHFQLGFSRVYSVHAKNLQKVVHESITPVILNYILSTDWLDERAWVNRDGGRVIGEMCHQIDFALWLLGNEPVSYSSEQLSTDPCGQDTKITLTFQDGSIANLIYQTTTPQFPWKERVDLISADSTHSIVDFKESYSNGIKQINRADKGQSAMLADFKNNSSNKIDKLLIQRYLTGAEIAIRAATC